MAAAEGWTHIKVRKSTHRRLKLECARLAEAYQRGSVQLERVSETVGHPERAAVSIDELLFRLLEERENKRVRRDRSRSKRAATSEVNHANA